jgi:NAD(P)-dependent dehydrogenase (short-subunit alcohol dehydrogenase family)
MAELTGKSALVTGAGVGIGRAIACALAREGASVLVVDFNGDTAKDTVDLILAAGGTATAHVADVSDEGRVAQMVEGRRGCLRRPSGRV